MFEQFSIYPEIKWMAAAAAQCIGPGDRIQINPDLDNFRLERFIDLRKQPNAKTRASFKLMLTGSSKANVFIDGPDDEIDGLLAKLSDYIGKSWLEISKIELERSPSNCENFLKDKYCSSWIIDKFEFNEYGQGKEISYPTTKDELEANKICASCNNFSLI